MRRLTSLLTVSALAVAASCADQVAPTAPVTSPTDPALALSRVGPEHGRGGSTLYLSPRGGVYHIGGYRLVVPPHAVCNPATSSYGPGTWDQPCDPATVRVKVTASVTTIGGRDYVDFSPRLRFVPSNEPSRWVTIHTFRRAAIGGRGDLRRFSILFSETPGGPLVDESARDATLATHVNVRTGAVWRRIEHFTGYNVYTGLVDDCTPGIDEGCYALGTIIRDGTQ